MRGDTLGPSTSAYPNLFHGFKEGSVDTFLNIWDLTHGVPLHTPACFFFRTCVCTNPAPACTNLRALLACTNLMGPAACTNLTAQTRVLLPISLTQEERGGKLQSPAFSRFYFKKICAKKTCSGSGKTLRTGDVKLACYFSMPNRK